MITAIITIILTITTTTIIIIIMKIITITITLCYMCISLSLSVSLSSGFQSIDSSVGWFTLLPPEGLEFDPGLGHNWVGYGEASTPKVCGGISTLKSHRSLGPQPLSRNDTPGWSNRRGKVLAVSPRLLGGHRAHLQAGPRLLESRRLLGSTGPRKADRTVRALKRGHSLPAFYS